jgi:hypothetical protein
MLKKQTLPFQKQKINGFKIFTIFYIFMYLYICGLSQFESKIFIFFFYFNMVTFTHRYQTNKRDCNYKRKKNFFFFFSK